MGRAVPAVVLNAGDLVDAECVKEHLLLTGKFLTGQSVFVDIDESVVVSVVFQRHSPLGHVDDEEIPVGIGETLSGLPALGGGHESEHLDEVARP